MPEVTDVVAFWNGLTKGELWSMSMGEVVDLLDQAVEEIEQLRGMRDRELRRRYGAQTDGSGDDG